MREALQIGPSRPRSLQGEVMRCDFCEHALPSGCLQLWAHQKACPLDPRTDAAWVVGKAIIRDLLDRRGIKNEIEQCDLEIQVELTETLGKLAIEAMRKLEESK